MASSPMSVHDPMGNSHNRGRTKTKQVIEKEGASTFNSRDENDGAEEVDDGGLRDFQESELKRQEEMKNLTDVIKLKLDVRKEGYVEEERSNQTVHGTSNGMPSSDQCQSMLNAALEAQQRNLHKNHASTQDTVSGDDGRDPGSTFDDGHEQQSGLNQANGTCDIADGADHSIHDLELRESYTPNSLGQGTGSFPSCQDKPDTNPSTNTNCGNEGAESIRKNPAQRRNIRSTSDDSHEQQSGLNQANGTCDVADGVDRSIHDLELRESYTPNSLGQGTGSFTSCQNKPDTNPCTNTNCENEAAESIRKTPAQRKTPEEQNDYSRTSSVPPTPQSKIESRTPETVQIVPGANPKGLGEDGKEKKVFEKEEEGNAEAQQSTGHEQLKMLEVIKENSELSEKLSKYLDHEMRVIRCWKHLAHVLGVPSDETREFEMYSEHSPTEDLFVYLTQVWRPELEVKELKQKLQKIHRNDLIESLNTGLFKDNMKVGHLISGETKFIKLLSPKLDINSRTIGNWRSLASEFGITKQVAEKFGLRGSGPSAALFRYIASTEKLRDLTMLKLHDHFEGMGRKDLVNLLKKEFENKSIEGSMFVRDVVVDESPLLTEIGDRLNKDIRAIKNWRNLAYRLKIPPETYKAFDSSKAEAKSPTKMMFAWLARWKPNLSVGDLLEGIKKIDRYDVVELVTKEAEIVFQKKEHGNAAVQQSTAKQLSDLEQMHLEKDREKYIFSNLEKNADVKGFIVRGNCGGGNCMFHALSRQLEIKLGRKISHGDLRKEIVDYLENHRVLPKVGDLSSFIWGKTWQEFLDDMAKDGTWGNHVVLVAAANTYGISIRVISSVTDHEDILVTPSYTSSQDTETLVLGHVFEYHYVSLEQKSMSATGGNFQSSFENRPLSTKSEYGQLSFGSTYQQRQQCYQQGSALNEPEETCRSPGPFQSQRNYLSNGSFISSRLQGLAQRNYPSNGSGISSGSQGLGLCQKSQTKRVPFSEEEKIAIKVRQLPVEVYRKICMKLSVKRNITFDDFRMVAEKLGMDRDTMEFLGQQSNPADVMFSQFGRNLQVDGLIRILHEMERFDVAAVLEDWVETGNFN